MTAATATESPVAPPAPPGAAPPGSRPPAATQTRIARLRRLPVPVSEPPYDDDAATPRRLPGAPGGVQGSLALAFSLPNGLPSEPPPAAPRLRLVPQPAAAPGPGLPVNDFGPQHTQTSLLPDAATWAGRLTQALVEVLSGARSPAQLVRWTSREVFEAVSRHAVHAVRVRAPSARSALVTSVRVCEPADGVAEVSACARQHGGRTRAMALRMEGIDGRWQCIALDVG